MIWLSHTLASPASDALPGRPVMRLAAMAAAAFALSACSTIQPVPLAAADLGSTTRADAQAMFQGNEPITGTLTLEEAMARALKYNMLRRGKMMEEALALNQLDVSRFDLLPQVLVQAGYNVRDNDKISQSRDSATGVLSPSRFVSQNREHNTNGLEFSWSLLDLGLGYYGARQSADRFLIATERRRKAMHLLMQDVRTAYFRGVAAQTLRDDITRTINVAEDALKESRAAEAQRVRSPLDSLRYQRQLLENVRLLEAISQELSVARVELAQLINAPPGKTLVLADPGAREIGEQLLKIPTAKMEEAVLAGNPDLREAHYNSRIAREEIRRTIARLFPNVSLNWGARYDSDSYLVNRNWQEAGLQVSFNLFNLISGPSQVKLAEAGVALADQRRVTMQMGALTQMHLARLGLQNAREQFTRADAIWSVDRKIAEMVKSREAAQTQSKLDVVSNATSATLGLLRRYQALAEVQAAENRLLATLGMDPQVGSVDELSVSQIRDTLKKQFDALASPAAN